MTENITNRHAIMVSELGKPGSEIAAYITPQEAHLLHMAVGIMGETVELFASLDIGNFLEECGDIEFYFVGFLQGLELPYDELPIIAEEEYSWHPEIIVLGPEGQLILEAGNLLDAVKKLVIYKKYSVIQDLPKLLGTIKFLLNTIYQEREVTRETVLAANLWKLREGPNARYKTGYSDQAAQERADKPAGQ